MLILDFDHPAAPQHLLQVTGLQGRAFITQDLGLRLGTTQAAYPVGP